MSTLTLPPTIVVNCYRCATLHKTEPDCVNRVFACRGCGTRLRVPAAPLPAPWAETTLFLEELGIDPYAACVAFSAERTRESARLEQEAREAERRSSERRSSVPPEAPVGSGAPDEEGKPAVGDQGSRWPSPRVAGYELLFGWGYCGLIHTVLAPEPGVTLGIGLLLSALATCYVASRRGS
jgi:hypothetical protein